MIGCDLKPLNWEVPGLSLGSECCRGYIPEGFMIPDPKRHVEVLGGREELMDGESRPQQKSLHFADKMNGSESKTKPIVFPFFFWGGVR